MAHSALLEAASPAHAAPLRSGPGCAAALIARFAPQVDSHDQPGQILELSANAQAQAWMRRGFASAEARWWAAEAAAGYPPQHPPLDPPPDWGPLVEPLSGPEPGSCDDFNGRDPEICDPEDCNSGMHEHPFLPDTRHYHRGGLEPHPHHRWHILVDGVAVPTDVARPAGGYCEYADGRRVIEDYSVGTVFGQPVSVRYETYSPDGLWHFSGIYACVFVGTRGHPRYDPQVRHRYQQGTPTATDREKRAESEVCRGHATQSPEGTDYFIWQRCGAAWALCPSEADFADGEYDGGWVACGELRPSGYFDNICRATTGEPRRR